MGILSAFKTDTNKEVSGVRVELVEARNDDGTIPTFIIARMSKNNKAYSKAFERETRQYRKNLESMPNEVAEKIMRKVFVETVLKGWENVQDDEGNVIIFSVDTAYKLLESLPDLQARLEGEANDIENFKTKSLEVEAKN